MYKNASFNKVLGIKSCRNLNPSKWCGCYNNNNNNNNNCYYYYYYYSVHYISLQYLTSHFSTIHLTSVHYISLQYLTSHFSTIHLTSVPYISLQYNTSHFSTLHLTSNILPALCAALPLAVSTVREFIGTPHSFSLASVSFISMLLTPFSPVRQVTED